MNSKFKKGDLVIELNNYNDGNMRIEGIVKDIAIESSSNTYFYNLDLEEYPDWINHWVAENELILHPQQGREEMLNNLGID
jgi:hypothetical protein